MTCLLDVNVWIALAVGFHRHHSIARQWEEQLSDESLAFCRITEMGLLRMLTNANVMDGVPLTPAEACV